MTAQVAPLDAFTDSELALDLRFASEHDRLTARRAGVGASDFGPIAGSYTVYNTQRSLWEDKTGRTEVDTGTSEAAEMGQRLEGTICQLLAERFETDLFETPYMLRSTQKPHWMCSPDAAIYQLDRWELVEAKLRRNSWPDGPPQHIVDQCQWQMAVTGLEKAHIAVLFGGQQFQHYGIVRDEERIAFLREAADKFWSHVLFDEPPAPVAADAPNMVPTHTTLVADGDLVETFARRRDLRAVMAPLQDELKECDQAIKLALADHEQAVDNDGAVLATYKTSERQTVKRADLAAIDADLAEKVTTTTITRRLDVKKAA